MKIDSDELGAMNNPFDFDFDLFSHDSPKKKNQLDYFMGLPDDPFSMKNLLVTESQVSLPEDPFCMESDSELVSESSPHEAFELVLPYLEMKDVLSVEGVSRSLRDSVRRESFLWTSIDFSDFFSKSKVTDDSLLKLTRRSHGNLQSLNLAGCVGITDTGLMQVLSTNPHLSKLRVSGCYRLTTVGMLSTLRELKSSNRLGIKSFITGGALYFTKEQFKELIFLLGADDITPDPKKSRKQRFYTSRCSDFSLEEDRVTDLEICPRCEKPSLVFDCEAEETCPLKDDGPCPKSCRACIVCIERCHECGGCLNDCERKPFCFAFICVVCYKRRSNHP